MKQRNSVTKIFTHMQSITQTIITWSSVIALTTLTVSGNAIAGGVCVVAKELGNSLAIEWVAKEVDTVASATGKAKGLLRKKGFSKRKLLDLHVQASTPLSHGHLLIIKTSYKTRVGKTRTSYGCGFSQQSSANAEQIAIKNLRSFSWGWKPEFGYEPHTRHNF